jgi:cyclin D2
MEASVDSGRGVSLLCCEKLDSNVCRAVDDGALLVSGKILQYMLDGENMYRPDRNYFDTVQDDIKPYMRKIVGDWMLEVCVNEFIYTTVCLTLTDAPVR